MTSESDVALRPCLAVHVIFVRYVTFAVVSGLANLASQEVTVRFAPLPLIVSILTGTGVGFLVKYILEKRWVFLDGCDGHVAEIRKILVYGISGVGTTLLFWAIELSAWHIWQSVASKYVGAVVGLSLGNWIKYMLDKQYVFSKTRAWLP